MNLSSDILICAAYIPPDKSSYWRSHDIDPFASLEKDICLFQKCGKVVLIGDFNARTGNKIDFIADDNANDELEDIVRSSSNETLDNLNRKHRQNEDIHINCYGNRLIEICKTLNMRILNGRTLGDIQGAYTRCIMFPTKWEEFSRLYYHR